jgi:LemA protein
MLPSVDRFYIWMPVALLFLLGGLTIWAFNKLVRQRNRLREAWSGIDVQLKRRHDLVPALVECVKGYRNHEQTLLRDLTQARTTAQTAQGAAGTGAAENELTRNLRSVFAVAETYPDLKAAENFQQLSASLVEIEDHIQYARRYHNGTVRDYNTMVETFPGFVFARLFNFAPAEFFEIETATERATPTVEL